MVICLQRGAELHMAQLMPLPLTISCFIKIRIGFTFLVVTAVTSHNLCSQCDRHFVGITWLNNNNNSHYNVYAAVIMTKVIARVHPVHPMTSRLLVDYRVDWSTAALITARVSNLAFHSRVTVVAPLRLLGTRAPSTRPLLLPLTELHRTHTCIPIGQFTLN